jgi:hypothetical protein
MQLHSIEFQFKDLNRYHPWVSLLRLPKIALGISPLHWKFGFCIFGQFFHCEYPQIIT